MKKLITFLLAGLLIACSPVSKYRSLPEVKAWESEIQMFEQADKAESYPPESIIFAGSSSIRLWTSLKEDMVPYPVIHRGYGGARLSDFAVYAPRIFDPHQFRAAVIFIANDITGGEADKTPEEVLALYKDVVKTIRKNHKDTPVFWIAVTPTSSRWKAWPQIEKANKLIKEYSEKSKNLYFIRTDSAFLGDDGKPKDELFRSDLLHLNDKGYEVWKELVKTELDKVLR
ncbi:MAG TPA: GDSL-type esterase/lipase family protein [Bacteroidales bacterium]|nr:GDSL-type esterase/lipase family protein [Bacteroidales bacterium]